MRSEGSVCMRVCACVCLTSLTATLLTYSYKISYESNANAVLKVFDSWISLKILCSKDTALFAHPNELVRFQRQVGYIRRLEIIGRLAAISNAITYDD